MAYIGKNNETYGDMEENILACMLLEPTLTEKLIVEEKHFKKFGYALTFFKEFYAKHRNLDVSLMLSVVKSGSEMTLMDLITYLLDVFVIPTHFMEYQNELLNQFSRNKKEDWLRKKVYEKATKLYIGDISIKQFNFEIKKLYDQAEKIDWR